MKKWLQQMLAEKARRIVEKYKPTVVAITGSVGKTSTRNAIAAVLADSYRVRTNFANYNNEFGIPFTIIGVESPGRSVIGWLKLFLKAKRLLGGREGEYPNMLVLEYGVDRPGDMAALCEIAKPDVAVLTAISPVHAENFGSLEKLMEEKGMIFQFVKQGGRAIANADDQAVMKMARVAAAPLTTYGFSATADVRGEDYRMETRQDFSFDPGEVFSEIHFTAHAGDNTTSITLDNLIGESQALAALAAIAVAKHFGVRLDEAAARLKQFKPQEGRMRPIPGIKGSLILDDSYNAAPASVRAALKVLSQFSPSEGDRRIAALGKMAELGSYSEQEHFAIGQEAFKAGVLLLVTVGEPARDIRRGAIAAGMPEERTAHFETSQEAGRFLDFHVKKGDIVLVKGSQSARMEHVVKDLMAEPQRSAELLVRQYGKWLA
jgi:UDP-N-acetylmuramoyl-tripeptide--D-alanyl-D-alanine ligase